MSASVTSWSSITKPPDSIRLWATNWRMKSASAGPRPRDEPLARQEAPLALARQQRLAVVELHEEVEPGAQGLHRVQHPEARAAGPGRQRPPAQEPVGDEGRATARHVLRQAERHRLAQVGRAAERDDAGHALAAPVGGCLVAEHAALASSAEVDVALGRRADAIDGVADGEHVVGEVRSRPPASRSGAPKSTTQGSTPCSCSDPTAVAAGDDVADLGREHHRRDEQDRPAAAVGSVSGK